MSMKTNTYEINYKAYQPCILLDSSFSFEKDIPHDDICRTVMMITERLNIGKYVDFSNRNTHGYDGVMIFKRLVLTFPFLAMLHPRTR